MFIVIVLNAGDKNVPPYFLLSLMCFPSLRFLPRSTVSTADVLINLLTTPQEIN